MYKAPSVLEKTEFEYKYDKYGCRWGREDVTIYYVPGYQSPITGNWISEISGRDRTYVVERRVMQLQDEYRAGPKTKKWQVLRKIEEDLDLYRTHPAVIEYHQLLRELWEV